MKKILIIIFAALVSCASCSKKEAIPQQQVQLIQPTALITSVAKVNAGSNWTIRINYTLSNITDVQDIHMTGSTYTFIPVVSGAGTVYDNISALGMVQYNFIITLKDGSRIVTALQTFNL